MRIKSYDLDNVVSLQDYVVITDAENQSATKNVTVADLVSFFTGVISTGDLEGYIESGLRSDGTLVAIIGDYDDSGRKTKIKIDDNTQIIDFVSGIGKHKLVSDTGILILDFSAVTSTKTLTFQDTTDTVAVLSDVFSGAYADLSGKPTIPVNTDDLVNNGDGVSAFAVLTDLPTNVSELANDAAYITAAALPVNVSELTNDSAYITAAALPVNTSDLVNDGADNTSMYVEADEISLVGASGNYSDLIGAPTKPAQVRVLAKTANYSAVNGDYIICDATLASFTVLLPAVALGNRIHITKKDITAFTVTVDGNSATINGETTQILSSQWDSITVFSDAVEWYIE